jgi:hypothetical protein
MSTNVCDNQDVFNVAVDKAVVSNNRKVIKENRSFLAYYALFMLIALVWAVMLSMRVPKAQRLIHTVFAFLFSPAYILAYYLKF